MRRLAAQCLYIEHVQIKHRHQSVKGAGALTSGLGLKPHVWCEAVPGREAGGQAGRVRATRGEARVEWGGVAGVEWGLALGRVGMSQTQDGVFHGRVVVAG